MLARILQLPGSGCIIFTHSGDRMENVDGELTHCGTARVECATLADIDRLSGLLTLLFTQEADFRPDLERQRAGLELIIADEREGHILVLRQNGEIVGMVNLLYTVSTALGGRVAILEDMIVHPEHRGNGAGGCLLEGAIAFARHQGCLRITLLTDLDNNGAIRFYQRHGFSRSAMTPLRLSLAGRSTSPDWPTGERQAG